MPKYLYFDHGGVLDGEMLMSSPKTDDLVLSTQEMDGHRIHNVLPNGVNIVRNLIELVEKYDYQIVSHSANLEEDQDRIFNQLKVASLKKGLIFPTVVAIGIGDKRRFKESHENPSIKQRSRQEGATLIVGFSAEGEHHKKFLRNALAVALKLDEQSKKASYVFDDGPGVISAANDEGYHGILIGGAGKALDNAIQEIIDRAKKHTYEETIVSTSSSSSSSSSISSVIKRTPEKMSWSALPNNFMADFSSETAKDRLLPNGTKMVTENYWNQLSAKEQQQLCKNYYSQKHFDLPLDTEFDLNNLDKLSEGFKKFFVSYNPKNSQDCWKKLSIQDREEWQMTFLLRASNSPSTAQLLASSMQDSVLPATPSTSLTEVTTETSSSDCIIA